MSDTSSSPDISFGKSVSLNEISFSFSKQLFAIKAYKGPANLTYL